MDKTGLLKEMTYLSRLLDKHKELSDTSNLRNKMIGYMNQTCASKINQPKKHTSVSLSRMADSGSKIIFINPERLKVATINKSSTSHRIVIPQNNSGNLETRNSSVRKVFINPNFKQPVGTKIPEKPLHAASSGNTSQGSIGSNKTTNSLTINKNFKQFMEKTPGNVKKPLSFNSFTIDNKLNNQISGNSRCVVKPQSCYVNPHFKGSFSQKSDISKKNTFKQDENLKEESKCTQIPQRIVKLGTITCTEKLCKPNRNSNYNSLLQQLGRGHVSVSNLSAGKESKAEIIAKPQALKEIIKSSPSCQLKRKVKCISVSSENVFSKNLHQRIENTLKGEVSCIDSNQPGPSKIFVNKEKWKSDLLKLNKSLLKPTKTLDSELMMESIKDSSKSTVNNVHPGRNIYVNRLLLTKTLKETQLRNSTTAPGSEVTRVYTPAPLTNCADLLKEKQNLEGSTEQIKSGIIRQRKRSSNSTCLISISKTKMVRKNKSLVQVEPVKNHSFEYLNKLKRLEIARVYRNTRQGKRTISRNHINYIHPNKISKLRKHSFVWSINNLVKINLQQKSKVLQNNVQSKFKNLVLSRNKYYLNRTKVNRQNMVKNRVITKKVLPHKQAESTCKGSRKLVKSNSSILMLSPTKLVRKKLPAIKSTPTPTRKQLSSIQLARLVKSKYKLNQSASVLKKNSFCTNKAQNNLRIMKNNPYSIPTKRKTYSQKNALPSLVNIGGVFYKATHNKLTRKSVVTNKAVVNKGPVLQVRGQRFRLDKSGRTLKSLDENALGGVNKLRRIDIGGVTFMQSKQGTSLVRTNTHTARNRLIQAKQRSITLLTKNLRKNNQPCPLFHRFGRCAGKEKGTCNRIHNSMNIAICKKFVQGQCDNANCLLSHAIGPEKMPTCYHYLAGNCVRDNCPYLHVKVNSNAPVCVPFLQGYCADGEKCKKRHSNVCPEFEEKGICVKGKYCPYPHPKKKINPKSKPVKKEKIVVKAPLTEVCKEVSTFRYFDEEQCHGRTEDAIRDSGEISVQESILGDDNEEISEWLVKRPKLGVLPAFIPLSMD